MDERQESRSDPILRAIEERKVVVIPRWKIELKRFGFRFLAVLSVVTGSIAMATAIYVFFDNDFQVDHDAIHQLFLEHPMLANIVISIPYVWLAMLALFTLVAWYGFRHIRTGYRYPASRVMGLSVFASLLISLALNIFDIGSLVHRYLVEHLGVYNRLIYSNEHRWTNSRKGYLGGRIVAIDEKRHVLVLRDFNRRNWLIDYSISRLRTPGILKVGRYVKMTGIRQEGLLFQARFIQRWEKKYRHKKGVPAVLPRTQVHKAPSSVSDSVGVRLPGGVP